MRRFVPMMFALATLATPLGSQRASTAPHPDFVGAWKLDVKKSEGAGLPQSMTMKVAKDAKVMTINRVGVTDRGEQGSVLMVNLDGSPTKNTVTTQGAAVDLFLSASWDGPALVVKTKATIGGQSLDQTDRWTMDPSGKRMHLVVTLNANGQTQKQSLAFDKQ